MVLTCLLTDEARTARTCTTAHPPEEYLDRVSGEANNLLPPSGPAAERLLTGTAATTRIRFCVWGGRWRHLRRQSLDWVGRVRTSLLPPAGVMLPGGPDTSMYVIPGRKLGILPRILCSS